MKADLRPFSLPLSEPLRTAGEDVERREGFLLSLEDGGITGIGEATPLPGWTEPLAACRDALDRAVEALDGDDVEAAQSAVDDTPSAAHALDLALADRDARRAEEPLYRSLGSTGRVDSIPANAVVGDATPAATAEAASAAVTAGFDCLKVKVGARPLEADVARLSALRDAVGPGATLRIDANGAWDRDLAADALEALAGFDVDYVEQPVEPGDLEGLAGLRDNGIDVAADESVAAVGAEDVLAADAADVLIVKPMVLGGVTVARAVAARAREAGVRSVVTGTIDGAIARAGAAHLVASLPDPAPAGLATVDRLAEDLVPDPVPVADGRLSVPQSPGHGVPIGGWPV